MTYADTIFTNAAVYTADPGQPARRSRRRARKPDRLRRAQHRRCRRVAQGPHTEVIDAGGRSLLPGSHRQPLSTCCGGRSSSTSCGWRRRTRCRKFSPRPSPPTPPPTRSASGSRACSSSTAPSPPAQRLDRWMLDAVAPDRPVYLTRLRRPHRLGQHARRMRRGDHSPRARNAAGQRGRAWTQPPARPPANCASLNAFDPVRVAHPAAEREAERRAALQSKGLAQCARHGLTSAHNMDNWNDGIAVYAALEDSGRD
jgi:predicted amidohydrolase YtcJ